MCQIHLTQHWWSQHVWYLLPVIYLKPIETFINRYNYINRKYKDLHYIFFTFNSHSRQQPKIEIYDSRNLISRILTLLHTDLVWECQLYQWLSLDILVAVPEVHTKRNKKCLQSVISPIHWLLLVARWSYIYLSHHLCISLSCTYIIYHIF